jgi:hypothetical protein
LRTIGVDLKQYKDELDALKKAATAVSDGHDEPVSAPVHTPRMLELEEKIAEMGEQRKALAQGGFRDRHFAIGSFLLASGVAFAIEGPVNTYLRAGKLFPGEHLYAGAAIVVLWALAAAMIPWMQKGQEWARTTHISLNVLNIALFAYYQLPSGYKIALKVLEKTKFPW